MNFEPSANAAQRASAGRTTAAYAISHIGRAAVAALHDELGLAPKPGLVSFVDSGSHDDMDARTFMRSLFALRHAFPAMARLGSTGASFDELQAEGVAAERDMARATGGINTHRGAIFTLGLLCAAAGRCAAQGDAMTAARLRERLIENWGVALESRAQQARDTHGSCAALRHQLSSASVEAAAGFPVLFECVWPRLRTAVRAGLPPQRARLDALFGSMAVLDDTNIAHRAGIDGLRWVQVLARDYLARGGGWRDDALVAAQLLHRVFVARRISPGGSADLLAAACWLQRVIGVD